MVEIRTYRKNEIPTITRILAPAFHDKITAVIGDDEKALRIIPTIIRSIHGTILVAVDQTGVQASDGERRSDDTEDGANDMNNVDPEDGVSRDDERNGSREGTLVGAIILSLSEFRITVPIVIACLRILGLRGSLHAFTMVNDYLKSEPKKLDGEGRLEAVGVIDSHRGKGIGKELVLQGEKYLQEQGMEHYGLGVKTDNPAYHLYIHLGFSEVVQYNNSLDNWIYMRKEIRKE